jgi:hypothetical protein
MTKTVCDICGKEMPTTKGDIIENLNFCISSHGKIWDIYTECRESLNEWMSKRRYPIQNLAAEAAKTFEDQDINDILAKRFGIPMEKLKEGEDSYWHFMRRNFGIDGGEERPT